MSHFLRGKQSGVQNDLSHGIVPELFLLDDFARYGVNAQISALAYDPVQSLLAVGTNECQHDQGVIYVYGQKRVCVVFKPARKSSLRTIQFCADKLVALDSKNDISVFSLETNQMVASYAPPGHVTVVLTDPTLDYCLIGLSNGEIVAYDLDREALTPFRIPNFWRQVNPRARLLPIVSLQFHPKDIGTLLIGYSEGATIYSFKQNKPLKFFTYEVPRGAPGGGLGLPSLNEARRPDLTHALWHPTGTFFLTAHEDASLVFWDPRDGRAIEARTIQDVGVNQPGSGANRSPGKTTAPGKPAYSRISWCSKENPDDTGLLIADGASTNESPHALTFIDLGPTPNYQTSSWDMLTRHFQSPRRTHHLPTPPSAELVDFLLIPRTSPYYAGAHDPIAIIGLLSSGELITISFPSGHPITPTNLLHVSLSFVHPFVTKTALACIDRSRWLGMRELRQHGPNFLIGGAEEVKQLKRHENRNIVQTAHADGTIRIWDAGHGDQVENGQVLQADLAAALGRWDHIDVTQMSMSGTAAELSVGLHSGEVVIFRLGRNKNAGRPPPSVAPNEGPGRMTDVSTRLDPGLKEGMLPFTLTNDQQGPVTALKHSEVGWVAVGYDSGGITVIDLRGPAIIYTVLLGDLVSKKRRGSIRRGDQSHDRSEWPTAIEFGVMTLDGDEYSSIALFVGTSRGRVVTFKILPSQSGRYNVQFVGVVSLGEDAIVSISPINSESGSPTFATGASVAGLQSGHRTSGVLVVTTSSSAHIFRPASAKGASKSFDNYLCVSATVSRFEDRGYALLGVFGDGQARAFSLPALKEVGSAPVTHVLDSRRLNAAIITPTGDIFGWTPSPSQIAMLNVWGSGQTVHASHDRLYDSAKPLLPRPTISNLQWISGTQYITPTDLDILIGGASRPPSKKQLEAARAEREAEFHRHREAARTGRSPPPDRSQEGYWAYMQRQIQERTEQLGLTESSMERTAESSSNFSEDVSDWVKKQKRQAALGFLGSKLGF